MSVQWLEVGVAGSPERLLARRLCAFLGRSVYYTVFACLSHHRTCSQETMYLLSPWSKPRLLPGLLYCGNTFIPITQVESLSPGHYFDSRREDSVLRQPRKVATEVMRKLPRMLPNPPHPNSAVFAVFEDALNVSRFVISGPVDTPYENGLFVFDVFLPANYPTDPPLVQMITTGQGTVK